MPVFSVSEEMMLHTRYEFDPALPGLLYHLGLYVLYAILVTHAFQEEGRLVQHVGHLSGSTVNFDLDNPAWSRDRSNLSQIG
jgi:hypothetical protein